MAAATVSATTTAMGSPTNRTRSVASIGRTMAASNAGFGDGYGASSTSAAVTTSTTPGALRAALTSRPAMSAWATVEVT